MKWEAYESGDQYHAFGHGRDKGRKWTAFRAFEKGIHMIIIKHMQFASRHMDFGTVTALRQEVSRTFNMARLLETKTTTGRTMNNVPGGEKVPQETKEPFSPLVSQKVLLSFECQNAIEHSATVKQATAVAMVARLLM